MDLTAEQQLIINAVPTVENPLKVTAFAGTGKTFTLKQYALARPHQRMLYVAFNKSIQLEASASMPSNVKAQTVHSLAFGREGHRYRHKLGNIRVGEVMKYFSIRSYPYAAAILNMFRSFMSSALPSMDQVNPPIGARSLYSKREVAEMPVLAGRLWDAACDVDNHTIPMPHDGYLKLSQLNGVHVNTDVVLMDEAQDTTPCVWDIISSQKVPQVIVGDSHQAIYQWRGASDFLEKVNTVPELDLKLTKSFRFGEATAKLATTLLYDFKGETLVLNGNPEFATKVGTSPPKGVCTTTLCRSNLQVLRSAYADARAGRSVGFVGGAEGYRLQMLLDVQTLSRGSGGSIRDPFVRSFKSFDALWDFAEKAQDVEVLMVCNAVRTYGSDLKEMVALIRKSEVHEEDADVVYSTIHKAKGLEWDHVVIAEDLPHLVAAHLDHHTDFNLTADHFNLIYVAITRGVKTLSMNRTVLEFIRGCQ